MLGTPALLLALAAAARSGAIDTPAALMAGLVWGLTIALGEIGAALSTLARAAPPPPPRDARPADGEVGVAPVRAVRREPNPDDPRFGRLVGLEAEGGARPRPSAPRPAPRLLGRVVVASIFLGRDGKPWSDRELAEAHRSLLRACTWIEREAMRLGAAVNLELADTYVLADDDLPPRPAELVLAAGAEGLEPIEARREVELVAATTRAVAALGLGVRDLAALVDALEPRLDADAVAWLLHPRSAGQSWAISDADLGIPGVSLGVCYAQETHFSRPLDRPPFADPVSLAHELLHLFGASDKYGVPLDEFPEGSVTRLDVMRLDRERLGQLRVDPLTASEIGWPPPPTAPAKRNARRGR